MCNTTTIHVRMELNMESEWLITSIVKILLKVVLHIHNKSVVMYV